MTKIKSNHETLSVLFRNLNFLLIFQSLKSLKYDKNIFKSSNVNHKLSFYYFEACSNLFTWAFVYFEISWFSVAVLDTHFLTSFKYPKWTNGKKSTLKPISHQTFTLLFQAFLCIHFPFSCACSLLHSVTSRA